MLLSQGSNTAAGFLDVLESLFLAPRKDFVNGVFACFVVFRVSASVSVVRPSVRDAVPASGRAVEGLLVECRVVEGAGVRGGEGFVGGDELFTKYQYAEQNSEQRSTKNEEERKSE